MPHLHPEIEPNASQHIFCRTKKVRIPRFCPSLPLSRCALRGRVASHNVTPDEERRQCKQKSKLCHRVLTQVPTTAAQPTSRTHRWSPSTSCAHFAGRSARTSPPPFLSSNFADLHLQQFQQPSPPRLQFYQTLSSNPSIFSVPTPSNVISISSHLRLQYFLSLPPILSTSFLQSKPH